MSSRLLAFIRHFITLNADEEQWIEQHFEEKRLQKGEIFLAENQVCRQLGFVLEGVFRYYINDEGEEKTYAFSLEGDFVCNYESFIPQRPSSRIIQALEPSRLLVITYEDLQMFYEQIKGGERFGRIVIEQIFINTLNDIHSLYTDTPEQRYANILQRFPTLPQRISQYYIASYVGIKPQSLSRIRKRISRSS